MTPRLGRELILASLVTIYVLILTDTSGWWDLAVMGAAIPAFLIWSFATHNWR